MAVRSAREAAYETIRSRIITMELKPGDELNDHELAQELGISRAAVWKRIAQLREEGWQIEAAGRRGYRLIPGDSLDPIFWVNQLTTKTLGRAINHYEHTITSSNTLVKQMAVQGAPSGSLCLCECQTAGKGRLGRTWSAPAGQAILMSVLLRPKLPPKNAPLITLATAMAMAHAVREVTGIDAQIKWPNDLVFSGKKLCGILLEISSNSRGGTIIGRRGETLDAMQYLSSIIANKGEEDYCRIILDSNGYREKRRQTLEHLAERLAKTVIRNQRATTLEPMNPYERRIIHAKVAEIDGVSSKSVGEDPYRKVVILPLDENGEPIPARRSRGRNNRNDNRNDRKGGYRNHGNGGNRKRNANPHRNREEEIPHKPTNFDDIMSTSFEKDYRKPKPEDDLQVGLYGKIE